MNWENYRYFLAVANAQSFKAASKDLGVDQTTVSRNIGHFEKKIGAKLFHRRSDGLTPTVVGHQLLGELKGVEEKMFAVERSLAGSDSRLNGKVRVAMPGALANHFFIPQLGGFISQYPEINIEFVTGPEVLNLNKREADVAMRLVRPVQTGLVVKKVGKFQLQIFASKSLVGKGAIEASVLQEHPFIGLFPYATSQEEFAIIDQVSDFVRVSIRSAAWTSVFYAVSEGLGIGILPSFLGKKNPELRPILPKLSQDASIWLVYHPDLRKCARVAHFVRYSTKIFQAL